ncbi:MULTISPECIES: phage portal protein [unclassified Comamonas]|uniref:phage portal protein n=1 Tax=unclassified Comamonas TaxID=2638500 RepID=UPI001FA807D9|nr:MULTISPECIES: phage portal protein [unclassified Comamonas]UNV89526.1 phage portal protein [Comamonas sp. 7D-2evo1]UNV97175.1 phage portal protein [Comamonas sp. 7D-2]UNV99171.1 phage portal protein [Comamonas sp. 7D-2evo2]
MGRKNQLSRQSRSRTSFAASLGAAPLKGGAAMSAYQGASHTDLALSDWQPMAGSADADLLPELGTLTSRARDLARNDGLMAGGLQTHRDNVVGAVLRLSAVPDYRLLGWTPEQAREWGNKVEAHFRSWADTTDCDAARTLDLLGLTVLALGGEMVNGDAVAIPKWLPRPDSPWATRLSVIEADRLETPPYLEGMARIRRGVELDGEGAPVAYHFRAAHPGDALYLRGDEAQDLNRWERVPAFTPWGRRRVVHLHAKERTGQSRGKPIVSAVMREFHMAGKYAQNELQASLANSLVAAFLESDLSQEAASSLFGEHPRDVWKDSVTQSRSIGKLQAGAVIPLPVGARLQSFAPGRPNVAFEAFMLAVERRIAAGMNLPYELFAKDFSRVNYSSARAALLEAWRYFHGRRRWLTTTWLRPIYELWLEEAVNAGVIDAPGFYANRYAYTRCRFVFGGKGWVDPVKEVQAAKLRLEIGVSTLEQECAEQGLDWEEVLHQQRLEAECRREHGLPEPGATTWIANTADNGSDKEEGAPARKDAP